MIEIKHLKRFQAESVRSLAEQQVRCIDTIRPFPISSVNWSTGSATDFYPQNPAAAIHPRGQVLLQLAEQVPPLVKRCHP